MSILSDRWIREQALSNGMIEPFVEAQRREGCISYGLSSYGYDARVAEEFKIFTNVDSATVDPKDFAANSFVDRRTDVCIIPPNSFALARTVEYFRVPPRADDELAAQPRRFLHKVFHTLSGAGNYFDCFKHPPGTSYIDAMAEPPPLPWPWLSALEMEFFVADYARSGFTGGLNWYRAMDLRWQQRRRFEGVPNPVPFFFVGSENDTDLEAFHGDDPLAKLPEQYADLRGMAMVPKAGHMLQMERPAELNAHLLRFLGQVTPDDRA